MSVDLTKRLALEADSIVNRGIVTRGQRLVVRDLMLKAMDEIHRLQDEARVYAATFAEVAKVYDHVTDGMISKPETDSVHVIAEADHQVMRRIDEALQEDREAQP